MEIYLKALGFIFLAEMGDKTQVLAMVLATRYKLRDVLTGILIGSFLNHGLAILLGVGLMQMLPLELIQTMAGALFVLFAFWTLKYDNADEEDEGFSNRIPMIAVAVLFFVGELGDKTQLTAVTLAMDQGNAWLTLLGTTTGMLVTSGIGIAVGLKFGAMIQEHVIKYCSSAIFLLYGLLKLSSLIQTGVYLYGVIGISLVIYGLLFRNYYVLALTDEITAFQKAAESLRSYRESMHDNMEIACLGEAHCNTCSGTRCSIGYLKYLVRLLHEEDHDTWGAQLDVIESADPTHMQKKVLKESLIITLSRMAKETSASQHDTKNEIRKTLETLLYGSVIQDVFDKDHYIEEISQVDRALTQKLKHML